ncbi:MAG: hypothetical protein DI601_00130 [Azospirillum brasilense]|nr:MAG: hypothetical protein DI601_00130 [Azospirillum brasilense]
MTAAEKARTDAEGAAAQARTTFDQRLIRSELRAAAKAEGLVDMDLLSLFDTSAVKLGEDGEVVLPEGLFAKFREAKPWAFGTPTTGAGTGAPGSTSNPARPPAPANPGARNAKDLSQADFDAELKRMMGGR